MSRLCMTVEFKGVLLDVVGFEEHAGVEKGAVSVPLACTIQVLGAWFSNRTWMVSVSRSSL